MDTQTANGILSSLRGSTGRSTDNLIPAEVMDAIRKGLSVAPRLRSPSPFRRRSQWRLWKRLVKEATKGAPPVGFLVVPRGGTAALANRLGVPQKNLWRNLKAWEKTEPPMVLVDYGPKSRNNPGLSSVQLPVVTELIVWSAQTRAAIPLGDAGSPHIPLVADAAERLAMLETTGPSFESWQRLDDTVEALGREIRKRGGRPPPRLSIHRPPRAAPLITGLEALDIPEEVASSVEELVSSDEAKASSMFFWRGVTLSL